MRIRALVIALVSLALPAAGYGDDKPLDPERFEWSALPAVASSSDFGLGIGVVGQVTRFGADHYPYRGRAGGLVFVAGEPGADGGIDATIQYYHLQLDLPQLGHPRIRAELIASYLRQVNTGYYGMGNASGEDLAATEVNRRYHQYDLRGWTARPLVRIRLSKRGWAWIKGELGYRTVITYPGSKLAADHATAQQNDSAGQAMRSLLRGVGNHWLKIGQVGIMWDSRDHEFAPTRGMYHEISARVGHFGDSAYLGINATARVYRALWRKHAIVAARLAVDSTSGTAPVYRLSSFHGLNLYSGPGGEFAIRGVPEGRYHGKLRLIGNLEIRTRLRTLAIWKQRFTVGAVGFADIGRVWAAPGQADQFDRAPTAADSSQRSGALKWGVGAGLRVRWGETFVVRLDVGSSPDGLGYILAVNHHF